MYELFLLLARSILLIGGLSGGQSFPQRLSAEEEKEAIARLQTGDHAARNLLIERNLRLVAHICKKYANSSNLELEDLISIGTIGLIKAVQTFDTSKNRPLAAYISKCVENEVLMVLRAQKKRRGEIALEEVIGMDKDGNQIMLSEILHHQGPSTETQAEMSVAIEVLMRHLGDTLTARERLVIELRYGLYDRPNLTQRQIAKQLGISRSYVSRIEKRALEKLAELIEKQPTA